eukprot:765614-Hanusia_phi.AAC.1
MLTEWSDKRRKRLLILDGYLKDSVPQLQTSRVGDKVVRLKVHVSRSTCKQEDMTYEQVTPFLDASNVSSVGLTERKEQGTREGGVRRKRYLAGGSCRYLFGTTAVDVVEVLSEAIASVANIEVEVKGQGDSSSAAVNHLIARYSTDTTGGQLPLSRYVASELAQRTDRSVLKRLLLQDDQLYPAVKGHLFEAFFFDEIKKGLRRGLPGNSDGLRSVDALSCRRVCLRPLNPLHGGYDAVIVNKTVRVIEFVHLTMAKEHSLKLNFFLGALRALGIAQDAGRKVKIVFVTERLSSFRISRVEHAGALKRYGWQQGNDKEQAEVVSIDYDYCASSKLRIARGSTSISAACPSIKLR